MATNEKNPQQRLNHIARNTWKLTNPEPTLCYEVWYTNNSDKKQMVMAYWCVLTAWKVMEAINTTHGNMGIAEVCVASGTEQVAGHYNGQERTDVAGPDGVKCTHAAYLETKRPLVTPPTAEHVWARFEDGVWGWRFAVEVMDHADALKYIEEQTKEQAKWEAQCTPEEATVYQPKDIRLSCTFCCSRTMWSTKENPMTCNQCGYSTEEAAKHGTWDNRVMLTEEGAACAGDAQGPNPHLRMHCAVCMRSEKVKHEYPLSGSGLESYMLMCGHIATKEVK